MHVAFRERSAPPGWRLPPDDASAFAGRASARAISTAWARAVRGVAADVGWPPATGTACAGAIGSRERGASWFSRDAFLSPKESVRAMTNAPSERGISVQKIRRGIRDLPWRLIEFARVSSERGRVHLAVRAAPRYALGVRWSRGMMYDVYGGRSGKTRTGTRMRAVASSSDLPRPSADELADPAPATGVSAGQCR